MAFRYHEFTVVDYTRLLPMILFVDTVFQFYGGQVMTLKYAEITSADIMVHCGPATVESNLAMPCETVLQVDLQCGTIKLDST